MNCKICNTENQSCFSARLLGKYNIKYYHCSNCDFVQTEEPFWLQEAYSRPINFADTGYMVRNIFYAERISVLLYLFWGKNVKVLDFAGGYGVFVRLLRDIGYDCYWDDKYTENLFSAGFEWDKVSKIDVVTLFEVFEHFADPMAELKNLLSISDTIVFSTELHPNPLPKINEWWYYGLDHGQHIALYSDNTFKYIAQVFCLNYYRIDSLHILTKRTISKRVLRLLRFTRFGLVRFVSSRLRTKTWSDFYLMSKADNK